MQVRTGYFQQNLWPDAFFSQKLTLCSRNLPASPEVVHRPHSDSPLQFDIRKIKTNSYGKIKCKSLVFASCSPARALAACLLRQDHICTITNESFCFHKEEFDEMSCKLDSIEDPRSFEKILNPLP